ncbi:AAA family ATPase [Rhodoblastus sp. 17X3]|uniref:AAA family ATPase n=1 Tax=Rhodoblastus sp. 17X3 TaxID=3047026 RepID=UPI0024B85575|nr:AAA family ATPase [Rhodoblastus sp. 17X3]MDI9849514.1 AAA family ATPase [Rhodoblastus sp. 17X3]
MHSYERWAVLQYFCALLRIKSFEKPPSPTADIHLWIESHGRALGLPPVQLPDDKTDLLGFGMKAREATGVWRSWRAEVLARGARPAPPPSKLQKRIEWLADSCGLQAAQRVVLGLLTRLAQNSACAELVAAGNDQLNYRSVEPAFDLNELRRFFPPKTPTVGLRNGGLLKQFGLIQLDHGDNMRLTEVVERLLSVPRLRAREVRELLLGTSDAASLVWDDFDHIGAETDLAARLVASSTGARGANILLYGPPGTGKSEFARTLGARVRHDVYFVGEKDDRESEPDRRERVAALIIANELGLAAGKMILVVDEADDLFAGVDEDDASTRHGSKVFMNRLVERVRVPTIWITNDLSRLGPAVIRRMNLVIRFPKPGEAIRRTIVERVAARNDFALDQQAVGKLAHVPAAPALIENAISSAARIKGTGEDALKILDGGMKAMGHSPAPAAPTPIAFDAALNRADVDLWALAEKIKAAPSRALSFCLSGPPGAGKSAYARFLAKEMGLEVLEKRYSDIISCYLGASEKAIAAAFEEAADLGAFLILDEADSLLRDRAAARYSWEVTQVNEMLTWMERHPLPFACTTNAADALDPATARRFLFKIRFLPMDERQIATAFFRAFGIEAPRSILKLDRLTPGDFAVVARKAEVLGERDSLRLARWLEAEVAAKPGGKKIRIGF